MKKTLLCMLLCLGHAVIYATDVVGGTHVTLPTFTTKAGASITATAVNGWSMKSAKVDNLDSWTPAIISGNSANTDYISNSTGKFAVTLNGELTPPTGEGGSGPTDFSVKANFEGELYIHPSSLAIWYGDEAQILTAKVGNDAFVANWSIESNDNGNSWTATEKNGVTSVSVGKNGDWNPPVGKYKVAAIDPDNSQNKAIAEVFVVSLSLKSGNSELTAIYDENRRYSYIAGTCTMPALRAKLQPTSLPDNVEYSLRIRYTRSGRNDSDTYKKTKAASAEWNINARMGNDFRGGQAVLTCTYNKKIKNMTFYIRGYNPTKASAVSYINNKTSLWYAQYIAEQESSFNHFNPIGTFEQGNSDIRYTPNMSYDRGFGLMQLTTSPEASAQEIWSWKTNADKGLLILNSKVAIANSWMTNQRNQAKAEYGYNIPVPIVVYGNVTFEDGTNKTIEQACAIKAYNSATAHFCSWKNSTTGQSPDGRWQFNVLNSNNENYVQSVCNRVP